MATIAVPASGPYAGTGTAAADRFVVKAARLLDPTVSLDGLGGVDTLSVTGPAGLGLGDAAFLNVSGLERLQLLTAGALAVTLGPEASAAFAGGVLVTAAKAASMTLDASALTVALNATGTAGADNIVGGAGKDVFRGSGGADTLDGGAGNDVFRFANTTTLADVAQLKGGAGVDIVVLESGADGTIGAGDTWFDGASGLERLDLLGAGSHYARYFGASLDSAFANGITVKVGAGVESVWLKFLGAQVRVNAMGADGRDQFEGGDRRDILSGGGGNDFLYGGKGDDILTGGTGADRFMASYGTDEVKDFDVTRDVLVVDNAYLYGEEPASIADMTIAASGANDTLVTIGPKSAFLLRNVRPGDLTDANFSGFSSGFDFYADGAPAARFAVEEGIPDAVVGTLRWVGFGSTQPPAGTTWTTSNGRFHVVDHPTQPGMLQVVAGGPWGQPDHEVSQREYLTITATAPGGQSWTRSIVVEVGDAPTVQQTSALGTVPGPAGTAGITGTNAMMGGGSGTNGTDGVDAPDLSTTQTYGIEGFGDRDYAVHTIQNQGGGGRSGGGGGSGANGPLLSFTSNGGHNTSTYGAGGQGGDGGDAAAGGDALVTMHPADNVFRYTPAGEQTGRYTAFAIGGSTDSGPGGAGGNAGSSQITFEQVSTASDGKTSGNHTFGAAGGSGGDGGRGADAGDAAAVISGGTFSGYLLQGMLTAEATGGRSSYNGWGGNGGNAGNGTTGGNGGDGGDGGHGGDALAEIADIALGTLPTTGANWTISAAATGGGAGRGGNGGNAGYGWTIRYDTDAGGNTALTTKTGGWGDGGNGGRGGDGGDATATVHDLDLTLENGDGMDVFVTLSARAGAAGAGGTGGTASGTTSQGTAPAGTAGIAGAAGTAGTALVAFKDNDIALGNGDSTLRITLQSDGVTTNLGVDFSGNTLDGGIGFDMLSFRDGAAVGIELDVSNDTVHVVGGADNAMTGFESFEGTTLADRFQDGAGSQTYAGLGGADEMRFSAYGGGDLDVVHGFGGGDVIVLIYVPAEWDTVEEVMANATASNGGTVVDITLGDRIIQLRDTSLAYVHDHIVFG